MKATSQNPRVPNQEARELAQRLPCSAEEAQIALTAMGGSKAKAERAITIAMVTGASVSDVLNALPSLVDAEVPSWSQGVGIVAKTEDPSHVDRLGEEIERLRRRMA